MHSLFTRGVKRNLLVLLVLTALSSSQVRAQFLMDMVDTSKDMGKKMLGLYQNFNYLRLSGYIQPQFQYAQEKGIKSFAGGDFGSHVDNRFMLRRARVRVDYARLNLEEPLGVQFVFQVDGSERGIQIRDVWGRVFENKYQLFSLVTGMFARPYGFEVNLSSMDRESPERGRMSQTLMKVERDLGAMISFEPRKSDHPLRWLKIDAGLFNGQGLTGSGEYDSYKDFIARAGLKPQPVGKNLKLSAGLSVLSGGFEQLSQYRYTLKGSGTNAAYIVDSSVSNIGSKAPRHYFGADLQASWTHPKSLTVIRAEYWQGVQSAFAQTSETPATNITDPLYVRHFNGAFLYLLHRLGKHQFGLKYDWYDPNTGVKGLQIGKAGSNFHAADIRYSTLGAGYINYLTDNVKLVLWYDWVRNEKTSLEGFTEDLRDNVFTTRLQFRF